MDSVNRTMYIPLYGRAEVSRKGIILKDEFAENIVKQANIDLGKKSSSKWLAYFMAMRARVFDDWVHAPQNIENAIIQIGCGLDSRAKRMGFESHTWYDVDFPQVIEERRKYYSEANNYKMLAGNAADPSWLEPIAGGSATVIMEGVSMYLKPDELKRLFAALSEHFSHVSLIMDAYTVFGAKVSKLKNPVNEAGVTEVYGFDDPSMPTADSRLKFTQELDMTPPVLIDELSGSEKAVFREMYGGKLSKKIYRLYEYKTD